MTSSRYRLLNASQVTSSRSFKEEVRRGLEATSKFLPCRFLYDSKGTLLFEQICELDEYYPTKAELEILRENAAAMVRHGVLTELGSGSARKARILVAARLEEQPSLNYFPIDISEKALEICGEELCQEFEAVEVTGVLGEYLPAMAKVREVTDEGRGVFWLGGSIGNMHREEAASFLKSLREELSSRDQFYVGIDLRKDAQTLERAYDDSEGVTAEFNLNLLDRINRELDGEFDRAGFRHVARYEEDKGRVALSLESQREQSVPIGALDSTFHFESGEQVHTEYSYKYSLPEIEALADIAGLALTGQWFDSAQRYSMNEFVPV